MSEVPCNGCRACCQKQIVAIMPEDAPNLPFYDFVLMNGHKVLRNLPNGDCAHLTATGCGVYENRPAICRVYDCRMQFKITPRNIRRQWDNPEIWNQARKRLDSLTPQDLANIERYRQGATRGENMVMP